MPIPFAQISSEKQNNRKPVFFACLAEDTGFSLKKCQFS